MQPGVSLWSFSWNARQIVHWWTGDRFFGAVLAGVTSFATFSPWTRRFLVLGNLAAIALIAVLFSQLQRRGAAETEAPPFHSFRGLLFGLVCTGAAFAICLVSYTAPRLNVLPALGICLLLALLLARLPLRSWGAVLFVPALLAMVSNQGTAESYRQAGIFNQRLYTHLEATQDEWREKEYLLIDTRSLRHRLTPGLLTPAGEDSSRWAQYGNAPLLRGFVPGGMIRLITRNPRPSVHALVDIEHGARLEGETLQAHARYHPDQPFSVPRENVFVVDAMSAARAAVSEPGKR